MRLNVGYFKQLVLFSSSTRALNLIVLKIVTHLGRGVPPEVGKFFCLNSVRKKRECNAHTQTHVLSDSLSVALR